MKTYKLVYNPYTVETRIFSEKPGGGLTPIGEDSILAPVFHQRMQKWLIPHDQWKGFFRELKDACGEDSVRLRFAGTAEDYGDLSAACQRYAPEAGLTVELTSLLGRSAQKRINGEYKLRQLRSLLRDARKNEDALPEDTVVCMEQALDPHFEINVIAPISAGKSTLQNAMIGRRLLPTSNEAKTAVLARTRINNSLPDFRAESILHDGTRQTHNGPVTQSLINDLNDEKDPGDPSGQSALRDEIDLEGPSRQFTDTALDLVFVDTPGGNNAMNQRHREVMRKALFAENKNVILFVFKQSTIEYEDTLNALREAAEAMRSGLNGKMSQDRFLFVCNGCDMITENLDSTERSIRNVLSSCGITEPNLFMVSALTVELIRTEEFNAEMTKAGRPDRRDPLSREDRNRLQYCIRQLAMPQCDLYAHASVSEDYKLALGREIQELRRRYDLLESRIDDIDNGFSDDPPEKQVQLRRAFQEVGRQLAFLNSGIPGLEAAIREYLNRYAIPMKIQQACVSIRAKAEEADTLKTAAERWSSSAEAAKTAKARAEAQKKEMERSKLLKKDRKKLKALEVKRGAIYNKSASYVRELEELSPPELNGAKYMELDGKKGMWIKKGMADLYLSAVNKRLRFNMERIVDEMTDFFNTQVVDTCNQIMEDYRRHLEDLENNGVFDLAGLDLSKLITASPDLSTSVNLDAMTRSRREIVCTKQVAKKGFWNGVKRFFGAASGYEKVSVYDDVEYVFILDVYTTQRAKMIQAFHGWVDDEIEELEKELGELQTLVAQRMDKLDAFIKKAYDDYIEMLSDTKRLQKEANDRKKQSDWLKSFLTRINSLLDVENAV